MKLIGCPESHILFVGMSTQMKMGLIAEENEAENSWVVFDSFRNALTKFNPFPLVCVRLLLEDLYLVWKQC